MKNTHYAQEVLMEQVKLHLDNLLKFIENLITFTLYKVGYLITKEFVEEKSS